MTDTQKKQLEHYFDRLWPLARSITGPGFQKSLDILSELIPFKRLKFASGSKAYDWTVPKEWHIKDAYIIDPNGNKLADFKKNNLHLMNFSVPFKGVMSRDELVPHLYSLPENPKAIPYVASYYGNKWGFSLPHEELTSLPDGEYQVLVDAELKDGFLESGECVLKGKTDKEILFSTYLCHPSMANNELSGPLVMADLYKKISKIPNRKYTYRFVINAETIGTICYLNHRGKTLKENLVAGYVLTSLGDRGKFNYKKSRRQSSLADKVIDLVFDHCSQKNIECVTHDFDPSKGSEERQYCSPGFDLPVGCFMRSVPGDYPEYHTSLDDKNFISFDNLIEASDVLYKVALALENNETWINKRPCCEPHLSKKGLYPDVNSKMYSEKKQSAMMWLLNYADGTKDILDISQLSSFSPEILAKAAQVLEKSGLIERRQ